MDPTLHNYVDGKPFVSSRGTWCVLRRRDAPTLLHRCALLAACDRSACHCCRYNIVQWAARTNNCVNYPKSVACMACAQNLPPFTCAASLPAQHDRSHVAM